MLSVRALTSATSCSSQRLRSGGAGLNFKAWARRAAPQKPWQDERQERPNPFRAASASSTGLSGGFGAPLAERQDVHTVPLRDLLSWYCKAAEEAAEAAAELAGSPGDGKPDAGALEGVRESSSSLRAVSWRQLEAELRTPFCRLWESRSVPDLQLATRADVETLRQLWNKRITDRVPVQYVLGCCHWRDFVLSVGPGCLIPRPETELLIDFAEEAIRMHPNLVNSPWADLGTGSGAIAVGLGRLMKEAGSPLKPAVWAVDSSQEAANWARENVVRNSLQLEVQVAVGSWCAPLENLAGKLGGIVSNPPYIPRWKLRDLQHEVRDHEPHVALDGGPGEGLDSILHVVSDAGKFLRSGGFLAIETEGGNQTEAILQLVTDQMSPHTFCRPSIRSDYRGIPRFFTCYKV